MSEKIPKDQRDPKKIADTCIDWTVLTEFKRACQHDDLTGQIRAIEKLQVLVYAAVTHAMNVGAKSKEAPHV